MDLPTAGQKLEHCTKARPRPNRHHRQPPSKPNVQPVACENSEDRSITRVDEGLEDFFAKRLITEQRLPTAPEPRTGSAPLVPSSSRTLKKKIGNFFAFKKPKSSRSSRCEKEPEGGPAVPRSRRSMLSDILRAPSRAGEGAKSLSKSEEVGLAAEPKAEPEHCQTPDSARRIRPKYSREGKSQSLILLPGEDEDALGVRHDKRRQLEKSDGELPSAFEQRMQLMLHRIGVTKGPAADSKRQQSKDSEIKKAGSDGDIVDSSADSPPSLKARTHSVSTDAPFRSPGTVTEPGTGPADSRPSWRSLGRSLPAEPQGASSSELRHSCAPVEPSRLPEPSAREGWSSSLPRLGRSVPMTVPRKVSHGGEEGSGSPLLAPPNTEGRDVQAASRVPHPTAGLFLEPLGHGEQRGPKHPVLGADADCQETGGLQGSRWQLLPAAVPDNRLAPRLVAPRGSSHRAVSVHEEQRREPECPAELASTTRQDWSHAGPEEPQAGAGTAGERAQALSQAVGTAQDSAAVDQRRVVPVQGEPAPGP